MQETVEVRLARAEERLTTLIDRTAGLVRLSEVAGKLDDFDATMMRNLQRLAETFDEKTLQKLLTVSRTYEDQRADRKEFDKSLRISVFTMIVSVLVFSIVVPLLQHVLIH